MNDKNVYIISGVSGSGKSTLAEEIAFAYRNSGALICCADDYFVREDGSYIFNPNLLGYAHEDCFKKFCGAIEGDSLQCVIVANTNTRKEDRDKYIDKAKELGVPSKNIFSIAVENHHESNDVHSVPLRAKDRQRNQLKNSFRF